MFPTRPQKEIWSACGPRRDVRKHPKGSGREEESFRTQTLCASCDIFDVKCDEPVTLPVYPIDIGGERSTQTEDNAVLLSVSENR